MTAISLTPRGDCIFAGNEDVYGLGVRVGIYLQVFTALMLRFFGDQRLHYYRDTSLVFMLASFINLAKSTAAHEISAVEVSILMWLLFCQITVFSTFQPRALTKTTFSNLFAYLIELATTIFFLWFWFKGIYDTSKLTCESDITFFFAKVNIRNWFSVFQRVFWIIWAIPVSIKPIFAEWGGLLFFGDFNCFGNIILFTRKDLAYINFHRQLVCTVITILSIIACELIIKWNGISGVYSINKASQLIPFMLGLGQIVYAYQQLASAPQQLQRMTDEDKKRARMIDAINTYGTRPNDPLMLRNL